jgi:hypothetical protein
MQPSSFGQPAQQFPQVSCQPGYQLDLQQQIQLEQQQYQEHLQQQYAQQQRLYGQAGSSQAASAYTHARSFSFERNDQFASGTSNQGQSHPSAHTAQQQAQQASRPQGVSQAFPYSE